MTRALYITPSGSSSGLTSVCLGLVHALDQLGVNVAFCKPVEQKHTNDSGPERSTFAIKQLTHLQPPEPIAGERAKSLLAKGQRDELFEEVVGVYRKAIKDADIVIVEGLVTTRHDPYGPRINAEIAKTIDAEMILVAAPTDNSIADLSRQIETTERLCGQNKILGCILNNVNAPFDISLFADPEFTGVELTQRKVMKQCDIFKRKDFKCLGFIEWSAELMSPRVNDVTAAIDAKSLHQGEADDRRVKQILIAASDITSFCSRIKPGHLILTPGDRAEIIMTVCMAALKGIPIAGLVLTDGHKPDEELLKFCQPAMMTGLPIYVVNEKLYLVAQKLREFNQEVPIDDKLRINNVMEHVASHVDTEWIRDHCEISREPRLSPAAFRYYLIEKSRAANKTIVLPEGTEPRTIQAAAICHEKNIAKCVLLGSEEEIHQVAENQGLQLPKEVQIIDPLIAQSKYIEPLVDLRKHKGLTKQMAEAVLEDPIVLGTMMLALDEVDGLVAGAINTTAHTIRPALQLIKTKADAQLVSSVFFMCLPDQVVVYGDCAVNPQPNAEQLADIAIQSADSAAAFGITPRVAMISYSTGSSGSGENVEKVTEATNIAKTKRQDLLIDGPLQYDAAAIEAVAKSKAPHSPVAGKATVFVFPDLNTGNTTYKAVQRSANVVSIGPMLQGLRKPVNDLSRGALVDDIVYTIALTCIQAHTN